ncbi:MAG: hypothetical protein M0Z45_10530 [Actinomycetota bacterium]|nr:hypothetical protein [Actinomycetota bacterium]
MVQKRATRYLTESIISAAQFAAPFGQWFDDVDGEILGRSRFGGHYKFDIDALMADGVISSPNILIFGSLGQGKSLLLESLLYKGQKKRSIYFDPKGDVKGRMSGLGCNFLDRPINPLFPHHGRVAIRDSNFEIASVACAYGLRRRLAEMEIAALWECVQSMASEANIDLLIEKLEYLDDCRGPAQWRGHYRIGDLDPLISACSQLKKSKLISSVSPGSEDSFEVITRGGVVDLSDHMASDHLSLRVALVLASLRSAKLAGVSEVSMVGIDELWALLDNPEIASWIERYFKLARGVKVSNIAVTHSIGDLQRSSVGSGLMGAVEIFVTFRQGVDDALQFVKALGVSHSLADVIVDLSVGTALWVVKDRIALVDLDKSR